MFSSHHFAWNLANFVTKSLMAESIKIKDLSPLVQSVLTLDERFAEMDRLSARIDEIELKSDFDFSQARKLMARFAECANSIQGDVVELSAQLNNSRTQAEAAAALVSAKAEVLQSRQSDEDVKMEAFRTLAAKVNVLGQAMKDLKKPEGETLTEEERATLAIRLNELDQELQPLIEEARLLKKEAQASKMKTLEQNAESLSQSLTAVSQKLNSFSTQQVVH